MKTVEQALERSVSQNPAYLKLRELGVSTDGADVTQSTLDALMKAGVEIDSSSRNAVLATIKVMGADLDRLAEAQRNPFGVAFGKNADLYMVSEKHRELFYQAAGGNTVPTVFVIDRKGVLRYVGYPMRDLVSKLVETLLSEEKPN